MGLVIKCAIWVALLGMMALGSWLAAKHWARLGWKSMVGWCLLRLMALAVLVFIFDRSLDYDIEGWLMHGKWMVDGYRPGVDFRSPYAVGFNLLLKGTTLLGGTQFPLAAVFAGIDFLAMGFLYLVLKNVWDVKTAKRTLILYFTSPMYLTISCLWIQDEPLCLCGMALLIWCATHKNAWVACLGMALMSGLAFFFTKTLIVFYLAPFLFLRGWRGALLAGWALLGYVATVWGMGLNPFDLVFGRQLGMGPDVGEYVVGTIFPGNIWSILSQRLPPLAMGGICFVVLAVLGCLYLPTILKARENLRERLVIALEWAWVWFFAFNVFYSMNIITYVLPMTPFLILLLLLEERSRRALSVGGVVVLVVWFMLRALDVYILSQGREYALVSVLRLIVRVLLLLLASAGLWIGILRSRNRFAWLTERLFPGEVR